MQQKQKQISIAKFPKFHKYIYEYLKTYTNNNLTFEFIAKQFFITGYSQSATTKCATIRIISNISINQSIPLVGGGYIDKDMVLDEFINFVKEEFSITYRKMEYGIFVINI